jgi:hypothetical protein
MQHPFELKAHRMKRRPLFIISVLLMAFLPNTLIAQQNNLHFGGAELLWGICHPFVAKKAIKTTRFCLQVTDSVAQSKKLQGKSGGQLDAFKHGYWMAELGKEIGQKKARKLGIAHERVNYRQFKKGNSSQDSTASLMDIKNNEAGLQIGFRYPNSGSKSMQDTIISNVESGKFFIIKQNHEGQFLDKNDQIIVPNNINSWNKFKELTTSNTNRY